MKSCHEACMEGKSSVQGPGQLGSSTGQGTGAGCVMQARLLRSAAPAAPAVGLDLACP